MKLPNKGEVKSLNWHIMSSNESSSTGFWLHLIELLAKGAAWESPNNPGYCQRFRLMSTN